MEPNLPCTSVLVCLLYRVRFALEFIFILSENFIWMKRVCRRIRILIIFPLYSRPKITKWKFKFKNRSTPVPIATKKRVRMGCRVGNTSCQRAAGKTWRRWFGRHVYQQYVLNTIVVEKQHAKFLVVLSKCNYKDTYYVAYENGVWKSRVNCKCTRERRRFSTLEE